MLCKKLKENMKNILICQVVTYVIGIKIRNISCKVQRCSHEDVDYSSIFRDIIIFYIPKK